MRARQADKAADILQRAYDRQYEATFLRGESQHTYRKWYDTMSPPDHLAPFKEMVARCAYLDAMAEREKLAKEFCDGVDSV